MRTFLRRQFLDSKTALKANLLAGMLFLTPVLATIFVFTVLINWVDRTLLLLPPAFRPEALLGMRVPGLGLLLVMAALFFTGMFVRNFLGRRLVALWDRALRYIPVVSKVYGWMKQILDTLFATSGAQFKGVVLVEYPRREMWAIAYVTGVAEGEVQDKTKQRVVNIFLPSTPNPTTGFYLLVPEHELIPLEMSVEDSMKLIMSGGILTPESYKPGWQGSASKAAALAEPQGGKA